MACHQVISVAALAAVPKAAISAAAAMVFNMVFVILRLLPCG